MIDVNYSNGFDMNRVIPAFIKDDSGRLAWRQPTIDGAPTLNTQNETSDSGRYFDDFHALCNVVNIKDTLQDPLADDILFNEHLQKQYRGVILECLSGVFASPELIDDSVTVYSRYSPSNNVVLPNTGKFVGYEINVAEKNDISIQIHNVTLLFNEDVTFDMHLFADGNPDSLFSFAVTAEANKPTIVDIDSFVFGYKTALSQSKKYWFGYFQDDLGSAKAIQEQSCKNKSLMFGAEPCMLNVSDSSPDFSTYSESNLPYGFNMEVSSFKDYTNTIVKSARVFDEVIGLQMAVKVVQNIFGSTRTNKDDAILKQIVTSPMVYLDMKGTVPIENAPKTTSLPAQVKAEYDKLKKQFFPKPKAITVSLDC